MSHKNPPEGINTHLFIRADANSRTGTGHLMRCLALAQGWKASGGSVEFITACENERLQKRLTEEGFRVVIVKRPYPDPTDWETTAQALAARPNAPVVLDGYHFDPTYQRQIKKAKRKLLAIDDMAHLNHYYADIVLNQNINAERLQYSCESHTRLLLGTRYALLRSEFLAGQNERHQIPRIANHVLVTLGGSDPENVTLRVIDALRELDRPDVEARIVVGAANPNLETLHKAVRGSHNRLTLLINVRDMPKLMAWADVAISAGGSTCWELAFMGLPNLIVVLAENQREIARGLEAAGVAVSLGWHAAVAEADILRSLQELVYDVARRREMSARGRQLVDGKGAARVAAILKDAG